MGSGTSKALVDKLAASSCDKNLSQNNQSAIMSIQTTRAESYTNLYDAGIKFMQSVEKAGNVLEEKIHIAATLMSFDGEEALHVVKKHPDLEEQFMYIIELTSLFQHKKYAKYVERLAAQNLDERSVKAMADFLALTGGAAATVKIYADALEKLSQTHITRELLAKYYMLELEEKEDVDTSTSEEEEDGKKKTVDKSSKEDLVWVIFPLRHFWADASDASEQFCMSLIECGLLPFLVEDVKHLSKDDTKDAQEAAIFDETVTIMHNCARHKQLRPSFRNSAVVQLLTPFLSKGRHTKLLTLLTLSYIIEENENKLLLADDSDFKFLLDMVEEAWFDEHHRNCEGYSLWELLKGLSNLAQNDINKKLFMKKGIMDCLMPILKDGEDLEKEEATKIIWELSFDKDNRQKIQEESEIMHLLSNLKKSPAPGTAQCADGALWVLNMDEKVFKESTQNAISAPPPPQALPGIPPPFPDLPVKASASPLPSSGHIMISYQWANQATLLQIRDMLHERQYHVWMDVDNIKGSTLQAMAEAVEGAAVVLMCMSQRYKESPNCRTEAEYAFALHKPIIPLLMEGGYKPDGWLGILKGSKVFFDFSGKYPLTRKFEQLLRELGEKGKALEQSDEPDAWIEPVSHSGVSAAVPSKDVAVWSQHDVLAWLKKNQLERRGKGLQNLSGANLKFLYKLSQKVKGDRAMGDLTTTASLIPALVYNMTGNASHIFKMDFNVNLFLASFGVLDTLVGCTANSFLLLVILTSGSLRANMRNVLIANLAAADLLVDLLLQPLRVDYLFRLQWIHGCYAHLFFQFLNAIAFNFLSVWGMITIDALVLVRIARTTPLTSVLTSSLPTTPAVWRRRLELARNVLLVALPWLLAIVAVVPLVVVGLYIPWGDFRPEGMCSLRLQPWASTLVTILFFYVPIGILALIFLAIASICIARRRRTTGVLSFTPPELPTSACDTSPASPGAATTARCGESNQEPLSPYAMATVVTIVMMGAKHVYVEVQKYFTSHVAVPMTVLVLADLKSTVLPFVWLLMMSDLKDRARRLLKSWRDTLLRVKPVPPEDVSVAYTNLSDD